jgi:nucleoside-diphosphate-sugar epimerase
MMLSAFAAETGIRSAWGRIFHAYGPFEYPQRLVASVASSLVRGQPASCTHGRQIRDFLHVADVGSAFAALLASELEGPVNIASGEPVAILEVVSALAECAGRPDLIRLGALSAAPGEPARLVADVQRLREDVGWAPRYSLTAGLADTLTWWKQNAEDRTRETPSASAVAR